MQILRHHKKEDCKENLLRSLLFVESFFSKDKILFFTDSWFLNFGVAKLLQEKYDCDLYAIINLEDKAKKFFQNQQLVKYE